MNRFFHSAFLGFCLLIMTFNARAQTNYEESVAHVSGKTKTLKVKRSYGGSDLIEARKGLWQYFDAANQLLKEENYVLTDQGHLKDGIWKFYNLNGELIREERYAGGRIIALRLFDSDSIIDGDYTYAIRCDSVMCSEKVYLKGALKENHLTAKGKWKNEISTFNPSQYIQTRTPHTEVLGQYKEKLQYRSQWTEISAENLIRNGDFSQSRTESVYLEGIANHIPHWFPASGTPDYYKLGADSNGMLGIRVATGEGAFLEYIAQSLRQPLKKGATYGLSMKIMLSAGSAVASDAMAIWLGNRVYDFGFYADQMMPEPQLRNPKGQVLADKEQWMYLEGSFTARGDETFIVIGSFAEQRSMKLEEFAGGSAPEAYYLIDDVQLFLLEDAGTDNPFELLKKGDTLTLQNVWFENDQDALLPVSEQSLNQLLAYLQKYPGRKILISGHTSTVGGYQHNMDLSRRRALRVKTYLTDHGIEDDRLSTAGFGPDRPVADNRNPEGQARNRRVEIEVLE